MKGYPPLSGVVLAGGQSRRLGQEKARIQLWGAEGPILLEFVVDRLTALCDEVLTVHSRPWEGSPLSAREVLDRYPGGGALGGIYTGLLAASHDHVLTVGCDMPLLNEPLLRYMAGLPRDYDVLIPRLPPPARASSHRGWVEPLHAIYGRSCLKPILEGLERGEHRIVHFFSAVRVRYLEAEEWTRFDPTGLSFQNINTPEDLAAVREILAEG